MNRDSFTKALMATAKIACCASLLNVSCRTKTDVNTPSDTGTTNDTATVDTDSAVDLDSADTNTETGDTNTETGDTNTETGDTNTETGDTNDPQSEFDECQTLIQTEFEDVNNFPDPSTIPQEVKDCCSLTAAYYDELAMESGIFDWEVIQNWTERDQCCAATEWSDGSMACTPWGPPTPPSAHRMKRRIFVRQKIKSTPVLA